MNIKVSLDYYSVKDRTFYRSEIIRNEEIEGASEIDIFEKYYKKNNSLRYCNGSFYKFTSKEWQDRYNDWLKSEDYKAKSFNLFYGDNGVVD